MSYDASKDEWIKSIGGYPPWDWLNEREEKFMRQMYALRTRGITPSAKQTAWARDIITKEWARGPR